MGSVFCCCRKSVDAEAIKPVYIEYSDRKCTDVLCCLLFLLFWVGMIIIAAVAGASGDPNRLMYATDYKGVTCGNGDNAGKLRVVYPRITQDIMAFASKKQTNILDLQLFGVCVASCPKAGDVVCTADGKTALSNLRSARSAYTAKSDFSIVVEVGTASGYVKILPYSTDIKKNCWVTPLPTKDTFYRCLWSRDARSESQDICTSPEALNGLDLAKATDEQKAACISKRRRETTYTNGTANTDPALEQMVDMVESMGRYIGDIRNAALTILICGVVIPLVLGFLWLSIVRCCVKVLVWLTIWLVIITMIIATILCYFKAGLLTQATVNSVSDAFNSKASTSTSVDLPSAFDTSSTDAQNKWRIIAYVMSAFTVILIVLIIAVRNKIKVAIGIIKEASKALQKMPALVIMPFFTVILLTGLYVYWLYIASFISSSATITAADIATKASSFNSTSAGRSLFCPYNSTSGKSDSAHCVDLLAIQQVTDKPINNYLLAYHFFGLLWTNQFICGLLIMIIAGAVCLFYFTADKETLMRLPVIQSIKILFRYHLGSVAFGSLIIAIVQFIRAVLAYLDHKSKDAQDKNMVLKWFFKIIQCYLWCFEKCLKFITKNAYIIVALKGRSFCGSAAEAVMLLLKNAVTVGTVNVITAFLFLLGKIFMCTLSTIAAFIWLLKDPSYQEGGSKALSTIVFPLILTALLAFAVATVFLDMYDLSIDTILMCFCVDMDTNDGSATKPYYASQELLDAVGKSNVETPNEGKKAAPGPKTTVVAGTAVGAYEEDMP